MYQLWRSGLDSSEIWSPSKSLLGVVWPWRQEPSFPRAFSSRKASRLSVNFRSRILFHSCFEACAATGPACWAFIWGPLTWEWRQSSYPECGGESSQLFYMLSRAWLPRILHYLPQYRRVNWYNPKDTNLALFIKITNAHTPFSSYVEMYPTDTLVCIKQHSTVCNSKDYK